jgi:hypothetical protein
MLKLDLGMGFHMLCHGAKANAMLMAFCLGPASTSDVFVGKFHDYVLSCYDDGLMILPSLDLHLFAIAYAILSLRHPFSCSCLSLHAATAL